MKILTFTVSAAESGLRLDKFLAAKIPEHSRGAIQEFIEAGNATLDGSSVVSVSRTVAAGNKIVVKIDETEKAIKSQREIEFEVIDAQPDFIAINKPMGLVVHPGSGNQDRTLVNGLIARYPEIKLVGEDWQRPGIVHRLDKETAGIMVIARTQTGYEHFKNQFKNHQVEKTYLALLEGALAKDQGVIEGFMKRSVSTPVKRELTVEEGSEASPKPRVSRGAKGGKFSKTAYRVLKKTADRTLVEAKPRTGRTHQLRVHFAALKHPIVGDTLYGRRDQGGPLMLLAWKIRFKDLRDTWREYEVSVEKRFIL